MTLPASHAYLREEVSMKKNIVTYRLLSRKQNIHVNAAKNDLASFYAANMTGPSRVYATFLVSGEVNSRTKRIDGSADQMDVDDDTASGTSSLKIMLVVEEDVEDAKYTLATLRSCHVYALSASPFYNVDGLCAPSQAVREMDYNGGNKLAKVVGKVTSQNIMRPSRNGKAKGPPPTVPLISKPGPSEITVKKQEKQQSKGTSFTEKDIPKVNGKLDWSKAKAKDIKQEPTTTTISKKVEEAMKASAEAKEKEKITEQDTRGTKRKAVIRKAEDDEEITLSEPKEKSKPSQTTPSGSAKLKNGVVLSDDEGDELPANARTSRKAKPKIPDDDSDTERNLRAMMEVDDSEVVKITRPASKVKPDRQTDNEDDGGKGQVKPATQNDDAMDEDSDPAPRTKPRKRKEKKTVPIGSNGLRKKRVMKSRMKVDEKGYMVTEDYSSYESVDEEEEAEAEKKKEAAKSKSTKGPATNQKGMPKKRVETDSETDAAGPSRNQSFSQQSTKPEKKAVAKPVPAPRGRTSGGGQKSLTSFFGNGGGKGKK